VNRQENGSAPGRLRAINLLAGAIPDRPDGEACESEAVAGWSGDNPEFIAELNRAKSYRTERLRAEIRALGPDAMATLRELV
jgi:hypothetical protein